MLNDQEREQAGQIHETMRQKLNAARADVTVTKRERDRRIAKAVLSAKAALAELHTRSALRDQGEQAKAYRQLFGLDRTRAAEDRAYRDSLAARNLSAADAISLYHQAQARGDKLAMTALAELAWSNSGDEFGGDAWHPILDHYTASTTVNTVSMGELVQLVNPDRLEQMRDKLLFEVVQPTDITGNLEYLASDAETPPAVGPAPGMPWNVPPGRTADQDAG